MKNDVRFNMSDFVTFALFGFTLVIKLRNFDLGVRFEHVPRRMSDFVSFQLFKFALVVL